MTKQPRDESNYPIPLLSYKIQGGQRIEFDNIAKLSTPIARHTRVVSMYTTTDCFFEVGDETAEANTANSHFLPAGFYIDVSMGSDTNPALNNKYISVVSTSAGILYISERI